MANEAFARVKIDQLLRDADWALTDGHSVRFEYPLDDGGQADYALFDRQGRALAVLEAKSTSANLSAGEKQGLQYADQLDVPFIFLSNGEEVWFRNKTHDAHFHTVATVFGQDDLARRKAATGIRRDPLGIPIDIRITGLSRLSRLMWTATALADLFRRFVMLTHQWPGAGDRGKDRLCRCPRPFA